MDRSLGDGAGPVKAEVHELELLRWNAASQGGCPRLGFSDQLLDMEQILRIRLARRLLAQKLVSPILDPVRLLRIDLEKPIEFRDKIGEPPGIVVENGDV